jgi:hypothetical protein
MPLGIPFSLQLEKETKEPRLSGICCKSTFYPVSAIQAVRMEERYERLFNTSPDCLMPVLYDCYHKG